MYDSFCILDFKSIVSFPYVPHKCIHVDQSKGRFTFAHKLSYKCGKKEKEQCMLLYLIDYMGAKVQSKTYFPGSVTDLNKGFHNGVWDLYHDDKNHKIPIPGNSQHYDYFLTTQAMDGYTGYAKEQIRQTILKHESIFKHQLQELHRLYKRQKDLMNPMPTEPLKRGQFLNQVPSDVSKELHAFPSNFPLMNSSLSRASPSGTDNTVYPLDSIKGKGTLHEFGPLISKCGVFERRVMNPEPPADLDPSNKGKLFNLADLNEPIQVEERETAFSAFFGNKIKTDGLLEESQKHKSYAKRTLFGIEIGERNHTPPVLPWRETLLFNITVGLTPSVQQAKPQDQGTVPDNPEEIRALEKHRFLDMWKNREIPEQKLPPWLTSKPCLQTEQIKTKEKKVHHINLDSLQNHSQQFFKKTENADANNTHDNKKGKIDDTCSITKILGVPIIDKKVEDHCESEDIKHHIDLNLSLDEEDGSPAAPSFPESVVKIATMEIDLEAPAVLESDPDDGSMDNHHMELVNGAAEAIVSISLSQPPSGDTLLWFAEVITCNDFKKIKDFIPDDMDFFEYMTLKLEETKETYDSYKPTVVEEQKEDGNGLSSKTVRKGQGRREGRGKIFRKIYCRVSYLYQGGNTSKRKAAARNGRGRRRLVAAEPLCHPSPPAGGMELSLEKSLEGWGRRTRRLPRQRCQNGGNHNQSLAMKC
ncbi:hypothetical protein E3N88_20013 [Mikania micrantha]|uniref:Uncharacterized protein n=1 Tax=Mikania micrantha TaxID=192012 RepID=A0A5N6NHI8_9ASTR|nr:hypothetical protein E3N88_20013 [Mikania micrantha]